MVDMKLRDELICYIDSLDIPYGFVECRKFLELKPYFDLKVKNDYLTEFEDCNIENRITPFLHYEEGKSIISIGVPYLRKDEKYNNLFSKYTQGEDYHKVVSYYLNSIGEIIRNHGYEYRIFCDTNKLPERYIAYLCGVGHIGRNSLLYTEKYGSYVFLGEIITNAYLCENKTLDYYEQKFSDIEKFEECGICKRCLYKCPNKVLFDKNFRTCISNLTQQKKLTKEECDNLNGMIFGCDVCQDNCPKNKNIEYSREEMFNVQEFMKSVYDEEILNMDNKFFLDNFKKVACSWRGKKTLIRNAIIKNKNNSKFLREIKFKSEELNNYRDLFLGDIEE